MNIKKYPNKGEGFLATNALCTNALVLHWDEGPVYYNFCSLRSCYADEKAQAGFRFPGRVLQQAWTKWVLLGLSGHCAGPRTKAGGTFQGPIGGGFGLRPSGFETPRRQRPFEFPRTSVKGKHGRKEN